jgi:nucleoside-diphosphate-sugar epimerase
VELIPALRTKFGGENVVATDLFAPKCDIGKGPFEILDVTDPKRYAELITKYKIDWVVHNAALLSGTGEKNFPLAMSVNIRGVETALELARIHNLRLYVTSSIAAFGPDSEPKDKVCTPCGRKQDEFSQCIRRKCTSLLLHPLTHTHTHRCQTSLQ